MVLMDVFDLPEESLRKLEELIGMKITIIDNNGIFNYKQRRAVFSAIMAVAPARAAHGTQNENGVPVPVPARRFPKRRKEKEEWMKNRLLPSGLGPGSLFRVVPCGTLISYPEVVTKS